jgi:hypothetical protein
MIDKTTTTTTATSSSVSGKDEHRMRCENEYGW